MHYLPSVIFVLALAFGLAAILALSRRRRRARSRQELSRRIDLPKAAMPVAIEPAKVDPYEMPVDRQNGTP